MSNALFRAIVGPVIPILKDGEDEIPSPYRRTSPKPPAPKLLGSALNEPRGDLYPTTEYSTKPSLPY